MQTVLKKQIDDMTDEELKEVLRRDYLRRLTRYHMTDEHFRKKYGMDFAVFEKDNIVGKEGYAFEVESDSQEWEQALDGIVTVEKKLRELAGGH
jgi:hypothetical protein